jgi:hypothetical protein
MSVCAPIALFIYSRPAHTARTLEALAANSLAGQSDLVIYADGPKHSSHAAMVQEARDVARRAKGFRSVRFVERERNIGLAASITQGVSELCAIHGRVIVVEDDLVVAPDFLQFLNEGLRAYKDAADVLQVSGYAYPTSPAIKRPHFLPMISCWGWATWDRAWKLYDPEMQALGRMRSDLALRNRFNLDGAYDYFGMACDQEAGRIDSWGVRWQLSLFANNGLVLYPPRSLVFNAGTDESGTHGRGHRAFQDQTALAHSGPVHIGLPDNIQVDVGAFEAVKALLLRNRPGLAYRMLRWIRR